MGLTLLNRLVVQGDCLEVMRKMAENSVDAVVTDPPYGLSREPDVVEVMRHWIAGDDYRHRGGGFMGKSWDSFVPGPAIWREVCRVLKPGGHLLCFGGTRTADLMGISIRFAQLEARDTVVWMYGSGFPKSMNVGKAIDKAAGVAREVVGAEPDRWTGAGGVLNFATDRPQASVSITAGPVTSEAEQWEGWGTALKPAYEPIIVARKPLRGTVAKNVLEYGTGALNIDGCRIDAGEQWAGDTRPYAGSNGYGPDDADGWAGNWTKRSESHAAGRWPANVLLDEEAAAILDAQTAKLKKGGDLSGNEPTAEGFTGVVYGEGKSREGWTAYGDKGGASRFFYCSKASTKERNAGLDGFEIQRVRQSGHVDERVWDIPGSHSKRRANFHPTVKPIDVMRWLVRLVTPPDGLILDPFVGSGTTGIAAIQEGFRFMGIEQDEDYCAIARARIEYAAREVREKVAA